MRTTSVMRYFWMRYGKIVGFYMVGLLVFMLVGLFIMVPYTQERTLQFNTDGISVESTNTGLNLYVDPSVVVGTGSFSFIVFLLALIISGRDRQFFVAMSTSRYEVLIGSFVFLITLSAALAVVGGLVLPILIRLVLMLTGFGVQNGWSANVVLTGGDSLWWRAIISDFLDMVELAGIMTLVGYLFRRWWKVILVIMAAGIVTMILLATQLNSSRYIQMLFEWGIQFFTWLSEVALPAMERYFNETHLALIALRKVAVATVLTALSYPVMRWMKVG